MPEAPEIPGIEEPGDLTVRAENISKKFGKFQALEPISFEVRKGEVVGLLGPNGAGKTTTMRILTGYFPPTEGRIWIGDTDIAKEPRQAKRRIGYLPESVSLYGEMRVSEFLELIARLKGVSRPTRRAHIDEKVARCGLGEVRHRLIGQLSKGFRQRVGLAQALISDPDLLVLDEPTNGLDPKQIIEIRSLIREIGRERTLILSTHILPEVSMVCNRVLIMNKGRIVAGGTTEELEAGLKKAFEICILIGGVCHREQALELLRGLPGVERVVAVEEKNDQVGLTLMTAKGEDLRPEISRLFVQHQIPLLEIRSGRLSLEEIFMKIVLSEKPAKPS